MASFSVSDQLVGEGSPFVDIVVRLDMPLASSASVAYATAGATAAPSGFDFENASGILTFAPGETTKTVRVNISAFEGLEGFEFFRLNLSAPVNAMIASGSAMIGIVDNDRIVETPQLMVRDILVNEQAGTATFVVMLGGPHGQASNSTVSVDYATSDGSAKTGSDYVAQSGTLVFAPGETVKTIEVPLIDDATAEGVERFGLSLSNAVNATVVHGKAQAEIAANDGPAVGQPRISVADMVVGEGDGFIDVAVRLSAPGINPVSVNYATASSSASGNGFDFENASGTLNFAVGETVKTVRVAISEYESSAESLAHFRLNLDTPINAVLAAGSAMIEIVDNDTVVDTPALFVRDVVVDEKAGTASFVVMMGGPQGRASHSVVSVDYTTVGGTALAGSDYVAQAGTLVFAPGETARTVVVDLVDDTVAEGAEFFGLRLSNPVNASLGDAQARALVGASDAAPKTQPHISVSSTMAGEFDGYMDVVVSLDAPGQSVVTVAYATASGTAAGSGFDFFNASGALSFAVGETTKVVRIELVSDAAVEADETFKFNLSTAVNAVIDTPSTTLTLLDNFDTSSGAGLTRIGTDGPDVLIALDGNDILKGLDGDDELYGLGGDDLLNGGKGDDLLDGGADNDTATYQDALGSVTVDLGAGKASGADGDDTLVGIENVTGSAFADHLTGSRGANRFDGGLGGDWMEGRRGADTYVVNDAQDVVVETDNELNEEGEDGSLPLDLGSAIDKVIASVSYTLTNFVENLDLAAGASPLDGTGNALDNVLAGNTGHNTLSGLGGNDRLTGGGGNDTLEGGEGVDTAVFLGPLSNYRIQKAGAGWTVTDDTGADGVDTLQGIETVEFAGKTLQLNNLPPGGAPAYGLNQAFLFDPVYYLLNHAELVPARTLATASQHYFESGAAAGYAPNAFFDAGYYKNRWPDLTPLNLDNATLFKHFNLFGVWEGRAPGPLFDKFDGNEYLADNPDVAAYVDANLPAFLGSRSNGAIAHYIIYGANEFRPAVDTLGQPIRLDYSIDFG